MNMARTVNSDTLPFVSSRYELGMLSSQRVRNLNGGAAPVIETYGDKPPVIALREIASGKLSVEQLRHEFVQSYKTIPVADETEGAIESKSEDPSLRELDAELEDAIIAEDEMVAEELEDVLDDSVMDSGAEE
ncbi:MAG: DNA-directed RNA polymerase subunit omega [Alphaproteobacteria bacterium]|nr:DNA-directed RNA polymerase subunit omega [Alphaproteobacteria bacterium]